MIGLVWFYGV